MECSHWAPLFVKSTKDTACQGGGGGVEKIPGTSVQHYFQGVPPEGGGGGGKKIRAKIFSRPQIVRSKPGRHTGGGGELVQAYFGKAKFGEGKFWYKILDTMEKCGTTFPKSGHTGN